MNLEVSATLCPEDSLKNARLNVDEAKQLTLNKTFFLRGLFKRTIIGKEGGNRVYCSAN